MLRARPKTIFTGVLGYGPLCRIPFRNISQVVNECGLSSFTARRNLRSLAPKDECERKRRPMLLIVKSKLTDEELKRSDAEG